MEPGRENLSAPDRLENSSEKTVSKDIFFLRKKYLMRVEDTAMFLSDAESSKEEDARAYLFN